MAAGHAKHGSETFFIEGEGVLSTQVGGRRGEDADPVNASSAPRRSAPTPLAAGAAPPFRFSRMGPKGPTLPLGVARKLARAMTVGGGGTAGNVPAGYTYLGQFVDHDLTLDRTALMTSGEIDPATLLSGRSPSLDLDSVYGAGPGSEGSLVFYAADKVHLRVGDTQKESGIGVKKGHDLPRVGTGGAAAARRAQIPDARNDENLAVGQTHLAFLHFHNRVVDALPASTPPGQRFRLARRRTTLHYQWVVRHDYLPRICDPAVLDDVWDHGRKVFEAAATPMSVPTMPVEFSVAGFRMGHSMIRESYNWNAVFPDGAGSLDLLFFFSGTGGDLGGNQKLVSTWIADWRRMYDFPAGGRPALAAPGSGVNRAMRIDTRLTDPLAFLPPGSFGGDDSTPPMQHNLAFRNLVRGSLVRLATGQQMVARLQAAGVAVTPLTKAQILTGKNGAALDQLTAAERDAVAARTPLWFYVLREAELNNGRLTGVGARILAETFHRAMEGSRVSIVREPAWRPNIAGAREGRFEMTDLLFFAFGTKAELAPAG
ncbi:Animal haem peroxidase [Nocardioides scoriae]|uniref:Animal haem peroxidase n=1 Tax=Nocardioides scoriae TaxID=642780 RepID=A0A1H1VBQ9_9ACTN|nr:heme peroxidase family protein [Nocardioides scoriae]SDS82113.1 Animal haem peroxidase [Nocardioides scoriae]